MSDDCNVELIRQLHIVASAAPSSGGEGLAALRFAEAMALAGCSVTLLTKDDFGEGTIKTNKTPRLSVASVPIHQNVLFALLTQYRFIRRFCENEKIDLVHIHGMWTPFLAVAALVARKSGIPFVISPHGCLEPYVLKFKRLKKWLALKTYQGVILRSATLFVATAEQERESIRKLGLSQPVAVIPNGVDVGPLTSRDEVHKEEVKKLLFLSRLHPNKGLDDLVEAWSRVRRPGWKIVIAGGDEDGFRARLEASIKARGLEEEFEFAGFVEGVRKQTCFDTADVFVLPTHSENFGIAIAEALANELPVITTKGAPWSDLVAYRCGWWVEPGVAGISKALLEAMASTPEELQEMGRRGRKLVMEKYSWEKIGQAGFEVSQWLLDRSRSKPKTVDSV